MTRIHWHKPQTATTLAAAVLKVTFILLRNAGDNTTHWRLRGEESQGQNIKRLRELKNLSQKEVAAASGVPQGKYSRIENGKVEPSLSTLEKLASVFEVTIMDFFNQNADTEGVNLPLMEKIRVIDTLGKEEKNALFKMIDLAVANKKMRDSLQTMLAH